MNDAFARLRAALADRYSLEHELGRGGMATVYLAHDLKHDRKVAIKLLRPELAAALGPDRFLREIQIAARLHHPHIIPLYDSGTSEGLLYYVMPFVDGESLRERLTRERQLPLEDALRFGREVADALEYAHQHDVVHRDIKPENIMLAGGHALVADFGIARAINAAGGGQITETGMAIGTPMYMSPEQAGGLASLDGRSDIYSLACVVYEMLAGTPPFTGASPGSILARHLVDPIPPLRTVRNNVPEPVARAITRALAKTPGDRFATAQLLGRALDATATMETADLHRSRRPWLVVLAAGVALLAAWGLWRAGETRSGAGAATAIAVLPFAVGGADTLGLGDGMVSLLSTKLDGAAGLRSVDPRALLGYEGREAGRIGLDRGRQIAEHFGAGLYVLGDVLEIGGRLRLSAALYDARRGRQALAEASVQGEAAQVFELVDTLAGHLLADWSGKESRLTGLAGVTTHSLPALKVYLEGERALRTGNFGLALESFGKAVDADTLFALAWYRMSVAAEWLLRTDVAQEGAERALALSHRLAHRDRLLLQAMVAGRRGDPVEADRLYYLLLEAHPDDVEAWVQLAEVQFHYGPLQGRSIAASRGAWQKVRELEPENLAASVHLARIAALQGNWVELDSLVARVRTTRSEETERGGEAIRAEEVELGSLQAFAHGDSTARAQALARLATASDITQAQASWNVTICTHDFAGAIQVTQTLAEPTRSMELRKLGHRVLAHLELARGHWAAARSELAKLRSLDPAGAAEFGALLAAAPFLPPGVTDLASARSEILRLNAAAVPPIDGSSDYITIHNGVHRQLRAYLLGVLDARLGNLESAENWASELERLPGSGTAPALARDLSRGIQAEVEMRRGRSAEALRRLEAAVAPFWYQLKIASPFLGETRERYLRAEAFAAEERWDDALRWFRSFAEFSVYDTPYIAPAHFRIAQIYERLSRKAEAAQEYALFIEMWKDADPDLQPLVQQARDRLMALSQPATSPVR